MRMRIEADGTVKALYTEALDLSGLDVLNTSRASHVEPSHVFLGQWRADLTPVNGPCLGPFEKRSEALAAEVEWIEKNVL